MARNRNERYAPLKCLLCGKIQLNQNKFIEHTRLQHPDVEVVPYQPLPLPSNNGTQEN